MINYTRIIPSFVGPKLAYHGFKYDETNSYPPQGDFTFSRRYWCTTQSVSIGPLEYDFEEAKMVISRGEDFPTEVPTSLLLIKEPGFRLWLSNKYLNAVLESEHQSIKLVPDYGIFRHTNTSIDNEMSANASEAFQRSHLRTYWEFNGENDLRRTLSSIVAVVISQGLDWFEEQVADIKRHHEKLEQRRKSAKSHLGEQDPS